MGEERYLKMKYCRGEIVIRFLRHIQFIGFPQESFALLSPANPAEAPEAAAAEGEEGEEAAPAEEAPAGSVSAGSMPNLVF
jgi:hypothetical protein